MNYNHLKKLMKYIFSINVYRMSLEWLETKLSIKAEMAVTSKTFSDIFSQTSSYTASHQRRAHTLHAKL